MHAPYLPGATAPIVAREFCDLVGVAMIAITVGKREHAREDIRTIKRSIWMLSQGISGLKPKHRTNPQPLKPQIDD
jgi:hypothetical protein